MPVSIPEYLTLLRGAEGDVIGPNIDEFYLLARSALVKDETHFDKFDRAFAAFYKGVEAQAGTSHEIPAGVAAEAGRAEPLARRKRR